MRRYYIDMDGTLAKWNNVSFEELFEEGYYKNLEPNTKVIDTVQKLIEKGEDVYILSAYLPNSEFALKEKQEWLEEHLPSLSDEHYIFIPFGENKSNYIENDITKDDILLDDYTPNLDDWTLQGGTAIKLLNGVNHTKGTWHGKKIDIDKIDENFLNKAISHEIKLGDQYYKITHHPKLDDNLKVDFEIYDYDNIEMIGIDFNDKIERPLQFIRWASDKKRTLEPRGEYGIIKDKLELLEMKKEVYLALQLIRNDVDFDGLIKELEIQIKEEYSKKYPNLSQTRDFEILKYYLNTASLEYMESEINKYESLVPDISFQEMYDYGYDYEEMIPLEKEHALDLYRNGEVEVYALYSDDTEAQIDNEEEILKHEGFFGVEMSRTLPIRWYEGLKNTRDTIEELMKNNNLELYKNINTIKIRYTDIHRKPSVEERHPELFYYDYRSADDGIGYTIERNVLVNNIGSLVTDIDILSEREFLNDVDFVKLNPEYVSDIEELLEENKRLLSNPSIKAWLHENEISLTNNFNEAIYMLSDGSLIDGEFCDEIRGTDHWVVQGLIDKITADKDFWSTLHEQTQMVMLVPENKQVLIMEGQKLTQIQIDLIHENNYEIKEYCKPINNIKAKNFIDDFEKMKDFFELNKNEFLESYSYLTEQEYDETYQKIREIEADKNKKIVNINGEKFILEFDMDGGSDGVEWLKWHNFSAVALTKKDLFYELQVTLKASDNQHGFSIEIFEKEYNDTWNGEWKSLEDIIPNQEERNKIESTLIEWSDRILLENNQSNSKEENNVEDDFEDLDL